MVDLDRNEVQTGESVLLSSKMPTKELKVLRDKLTRATRSVEFRPHPDLQMVDDAFFKILADPDDADDQINPLEARDAFLEFMSRLMENYKKYIKDPGQT